MSAFRAQDGITARCFRCFCCFARKLSAGGISFSAEMLGRRRFGEPENSGAIAVLLLFFAVFGHPGVAARARLSQPILLRSK
jgi:hypothetical protein